MKIARILIAVVLLWSSSIGSGRAAGSIVRRVNAPYFTTNDLSQKFGEMAIFWFGRVTPTENYADVRVAYNVIELYVYVAVFDRQLWYNTTPSATDLEKWDAVTLYFDRGGNAGNAPGTSAHRFVAQLNWWENRSAYQAAYRGNGSSWIDDTSAFTTTTPYRGDGAPNDGLDKRGWATVFRVPFSSLGLSSPPTSGSIWGLALALHDRDDAGGTFIADKTWPESIDPNQSVTWGQLAFGLPTYTPPVATSPQTTIIRHRLNGATVPDGGVGGYTNCGNGLNFWSEWGTRVYNTFPNGDPYGDFNIQNQSDIADWPCFSRYFVTFPLNVIPANKVIISATLTLHQFGGSGGPGQATPSLIQVLTVNEDWSAATLSWNSAPLAVENIGRAWVQPLPGACSWPCVPRSWDVSAAVAKAYSAGAPLRLALYSADSDYHSGKYFVSSDTGDWNASGRPTLSVTWGEARPSVIKSVWPVTGSAGDTITYTLRLIGSGQPLTLTDDLPASISAPINLQASSGSIGYAANVHRVTWTGTPSVGQATTATIAVSVENVIGPVAIVNTAQLSDTLGLASSSSAVFIKDAVVIWLPLARK